MNARRAFEAHYAAYDELYRQAWGDTLHHGLWRTGRETQPEAVSALSRQIAEMAGLRTGQRVYDVGCGYGAMSCWLAREYRVEVIGINSSETQLARASVEEKVRWIHANWLTLPVEPVDAVLAVESADHIGDKALFLRQGRRALVPGGRLVLAGLTRPSHLTPRQSRRLAWIRAHSPLAPLASAEELCSLARREGFTVERAWDLTRETARTWPEYARRFLGLSLRQPRFLRFLLPTGEAGWLPWLLWQLLLATRSGALRYSVLRLDAAA